MNIYQKIVELQEKQIPSALVTVLSTKGSVPREAGCKMIVLETGQIFGTIGGSSVEARVINEAITAIQSQKIRLVSHDLFDQEEKDTGMVCGGTMEFLIEPLTVGEKLFVFGGGHVALPVVQLAVKIGFSVTVIDDRSEFAAKDRFPEAHQCIQAQPGKYAEELELSDRDYVVIVTPGHKDDYAVLRGVIKKPVKYLGMIGSKVKRKEIYEKLKTNDGVTEAELKKVHCPIGLEIGSETPEEIAVSIVAELIKIKRSTK
ncbi:MAG TPA: xanthine dehydrogenase [Caldithrix sp.]|nr:XdhC family protein [Calditrichaceae bacterium]HEM49473.1 xanthine dehydrogenase [Caldithrix sp.]HES59964.1 xanthine dehydrogenase [Caldithrix sp.]